MSFAYTEDTLASVAEMPDDSQVPWFDKAVVDHARISASYNADYLTSWRDSGVVILKNFLDPDLGEAYFKVREQLKSGGPYMQQGYMDPCPYIYIPELRALSLDPRLLAIMDELIGMQMGLHLNLTGWVSTERAWHQDDYLNPSFVNSHYAAVWFALRDIDPRSGPFEYVAGSHKWPLTRREKVLALHPTRVDPGDPDWPTKTQDWVSGIFQKEIERRRADVKQFVAKRGDVLIWHGRLVHRGSIPQVPGMLRHSLIAHYSAIEKRTDMRGLRDRCFTASREGEWR